MRKTVQRKPEGFFGRVWYFIWKDDSIWSLLFDLFLAFVIVKFILYPALEHGLNTSYPVVAVLTSSMEHKPKDDMLCGNYVEDYSKSFENYWDVCGEWYEEQGITKEEFQEFPFPNGFNVGDILFVRGVPFEEYKVGDVAVFWTSLEYPIIHRVVAVNEENRTITTKGDQNRDQLNEETEISEEDLVGKAFFRIPYLGYVKVWTSRLGELIMNSPSAQQSITIASQ
ncbi:MAG: signal peptidase [Candidatus Woesearchaeota archaeon]|nr:signal peptidase [Candidatus Woesearchaeota archaeon]